MLKYERPFMICELICCLSSSIDSPASLLHHLYSGSAFHCPLKQVLLSGGVDSTVCASLLSRTIDPSQIIAVHIDNGFMRKHESDLVVKVLTDLGIKGN